MEHNVRPWGSFTVHAAFPSATLKTLEVLPGARLSLQSHTKRSEIWLLMSGDLQATRGPDRDHLTLTELEPGVPVTIAVGELHRLESRGGGVAVEVAHGDFDEDDIVRYEDDYGRVSA